MHSRQEEIEQASQISQQDLSNYNGLHSHESEIEQASHISHQDLNNNLHAN